MLKFAIIGLGGLGKLHLRNMIELEEKRGDIKLTALCDIEESRFTERVETNLGGDTSSIDLSRYNLYTDVHELLEKEVLDFVITALPTYLHEEIAVLALSNGLHVFSEKPMARTLEQCQNMINKAKENNRLLMIGQCLRYRPEYIKLKEYIDSGEFGDAVRAEFYRYSPTPVWSWQNWMMDFDKSGGAALDLHVHDVDMIHWLFGLPQAVTSSATNVKTKFDSIFTTYQYDGVLVTSAGDWGLTNSYPFQAAFLVRFEKAVVELKDVMKIYPEDGEAYVVEPEAGNAYTDEVNDFINCVKENRELSVVTPESVMLTMKIALAEMKSAEKGEKINVQ